MVNKADAYLFLNSIKIIENNLSNLSGDQLSLQKIESELSAMKLVLERDYIK